MIISGNESDSKKPQESPQSEWTTSNETTVVPSGSDFDPDPDSGGMGRCMKRICRLWRKKKMNNKLEVIGIDHGWSMMKTISQVFVTGVKEITTTPALFGDVLEYEGKFYKVGTVRQEVKDTKVEDDSFYLLTLAAVAKELKRRGLAEAKVFLAVGLPLTRFGAEKNDFIKYLTKNKRVSFKYDKK
jgi:plasmid segregation protein ParM